MKLKAIAYMSAALLICALCTYFIGCSNNNQYGKFSPEQMKDIPIVKRSELPPPTGGVTLSVMGETISVEDILAQPKAEEVLKPLAESGNYDLFRTQARPIIARTVMGKVSDIMIYHLASKEHPPNMESHIDKLVQKEVNNFVSNYNNDYAQAERAFKKMGITDWNEFREYKKKLMITQAYLAKKIKNDDPITHGEMITRYNELKDEFFQWEGKMKFRLIDIVPDKLEPGEISEGETAYQAAVRKAKDLKQKLENGEEFSNLAETHSHGIGKNNGGLWEPVSEGSLAEPYDQLEKAAKSMEPGDISEIIETGGHVFIMKLEDKTESGNTPFAEVQDRIEEEIKLIRQRKEYNKIISDIVKQANVSNMELFTKYSLQKAYEKFKP